MVKITPINEASEHLAAVKKLWRADSDTLGFLPAGAFNEYASKRCILVALDGNKCIGYLLYRTSDRAATIAHLCVHPDARGKDLARQLVRHLSSITGHLDGIRLTCRRDFDVYRLWPKLGFSPIQEKPGRAANGSETTRFWLSHGHADLFTHQTSTAKVVLDANIFVDLIESQNEETRGLVADWLSGSVTYFVTAELFNDLDRTEDAKERRRRMVEAQFFQELTHSVDAFDQAEQQLDAIFNDRRTEQDKSDFRHVVRAVAAGADALVTRDAKLLDKADSVYAATGLRIMRPAELVGRIDELLHEQEYQPFQIAGTKRIERKRCSRIDDELIRGVADPGERHHTIRTTLNNFVADPTRYACFQIRDKGGTLLAVYAVQKDDDFLYVPFIRVCPHRLAGTVARTILTGLCRECAIDKKHGVRVANDSLSEPLSGACTDLGFVPVTDGFVKLVFTGIRLPDELAGRVAEAAKDDPALLRISEVLKTEFDSSTASELEHLLWPVKLLHPNLPTFIVPIRAKYAQELFDEGLAERTLFGADVELALNPESAYYRSARPRIVGVPGRILWYVSKGNGDGPMAIRACSRVAEVQVGRPKPLFRQFERFGVYRWDDVFETAKKNAEKDIMAIRFHDTELLRPIHWKTFQPILKAHGINTNLESPCRIGPEAFATIYAAAFDSPEAR